MSRNWHLHSGGTKPLRDAGMPADQIEQWKQAGSITHAHILELWQAGYRAGHYKGFPTRMEGNDRLTLLRHGVTPAIRRKWTKAMRDAIPEPKFATPTHKQRLADRFADHLPTLLAAGITLDALLPYLAAGATQPERTLLAITHHIPAVIAEPFTSAFGSGPRARRAAEAAWTYLVDNDKIEHLHAFMNEHLSVEQAMLWIRADVDPIRARLLTALGVHPAATTEEERTADLDTLQTLAALRGHPVGLDARLLLAA